MADPLPAPWRPAGAAELLAAFARVDGLECGYVEEKHLALLAAPLTSRGRLYYLRPGHLTRVVEGEPPTILRISPTHLRTSGPEGEEVIDLAANADVRTLVTALVSVFAGDGAVLQSSFAVTFEATETGWTLRLTPRREPLTKLIGELRFDGQGLAVSRLEVLEANGDRTVTRIEEADPERRFSPAERRDLFGITSS